MRTRDARDGRFLPDGTEKRRPSTTVRENISGTGDRTQKRTRDAKDGRFLPDGTEKRRPSTTVRTTINKKKYK